MDERNPILSWIPNELGWLSKQIRPHLHLHLGTFLCLTAGSALGLLTPLVIRWLIDQVIPGKQMGLLLLSVGLIFVSYLGRTALTAAGNYLMLSAAQRMGLTLRMRLLRHLDTLSADYYEDTAVGTVMYPLKEPIDEISYFGSDLLPGLLRSLLSTSLTVAIMFALSPTLTFAVLPLVPAFLIIRRHFRQRLTVDSDTVQAERIAWSAFLEEHLSSVVFVQLLGQQRRQERRAFHHMARTVRSQQRLLKSGFWFTVGNSLAVVLSICAVIGWGGARVLAGSLSVGSLVAFYNFVTQLFEPLSAAAELYARSQKAFASIRQVQSALRLNPRVTNAEITIRLSQDRPGQIDFVGVKFGYQRQKNMLQVPSLRILPGERVAVVGENGAGKSTLAKLITRIYDVDAGSISIGGEDIRRIKLECFRRYVCYLPRDPILFNGSLVSNLYFVNSAASNLELERALQCAGLSAFVAMLPDGLHQRIGPGACQLSGGQRQRLAIARALIQKPQVLILDEATSCLDSCSEAQLFRDIQENLAATTLIVISHRNSTLSPFQRVIVLRDGHIVGDGSPDSLLACSRLYC